MHFNFDSRTRTHLTFLVHYTTPFPVRCISLWIKRTISQGWDLAKKYRNK